VLSNNPENFRVFGPDETASNRLDDVYQVTDKAWQGEVLPTDEHLGRQGKVIEVLSENLTQGLLEGYLLTGRHGLFSSYEAFIHVVDSMFNQYAKWLDSSRCRMAPPGCLVQLPALLPRLAPGPQRVLAPGPRIPRPRCQ
jgi:xylulose-5-phosphate/fructose-6-phosphate phosphoketolase